MSRARRTPAGTEGWGVEWGWGFGDWEDGGLPPPALVWGAHHTIVASTENFPLPVAIWVLLRLPMGAQRERAAGFNTTDTIKPQYLTKGPLRARAIRMHGGGHLEKTLVIALMKDWHSVIALMKDGLFARYCKKAAPCRSLAGTQYVYTSWPERENNTLNYMHNGTY